MESIEDVYKEAIKRKSDKADISLSEVMEILDFNEKDLKEIESMIEDKEEF